MSVKTRTTYFIQHEEQEFETSFQPVDGSEKVTIKGDKAVVSYLSQDEAYGWYFDENDQGRFINFDPRCMGERLSEDEIKEIIKENKGRVFTINKYEHGLCRYYRDGDAQTSSRIPDQQWDVSHGCALYVAPDDCPDPAKYCDSVMEEFTNWCNGEIYGICHDVYRKIGDAWKKQDEDCDACWGFIGCEYAEGELDGEHEGRIDD